MSNTQKKQPIDKEKRLGKLIKRLQAEECSLAGQSTLLTEVKIMLNEFVMALI